MRLGYLFPALVVICAGPAGLHAEDGQAMKDAGGIFQKLSSNAKLSVPAGTYRIPKGGITLRDLRDIEIDGTGVKLVASDLTASALTLSNCRNIRLHGFTVDYDPLPFTQGTVTAINIRGRTVDFTIHKGYSELPDNCQLRHIHLFEKEGGRWKPDAPDYYAKRVERLEGRSCRAWFPKDARGLDRIETGDRIALNIRRTPAISIADGSGGVELEDFTINSAPGIAILIRYAEDGGTLRRVKVVPGPPPAGASEPRLLSSSADALNIAYTRRGPVVEQCEFSRMGDDSINLHGVVFPVLKWIDGSTFLTMRPHRGEDFDRILRAGDEIRFLADGDFRLITSARIAKVERTTEDSQAWADTFHRYWPSVPPSKDFGFFLVKLDHTVENVPVGAYTEVPAMAAPNFVIRDSWFHDHRARGLRLMSSSGLVEGNRFERISGVAISMGPQFPFWAEAGWCEDIKIKNNSITDVAQGTDVCLPDSYTLGAISVSCRMGDGADHSRSYGGNKNISITDNLINGCSVDGINASAARDLVITGNTIERVDLRPCPGAGEKQGLKAGSPISIIHAQATVENNTIK